MLASSDLRIVVGAIEMSNILMEKLSNIFSVYFVREGVLHQFNKLMKECDNTISDFSTVSDSPLSTTPTSNPSIKTEFNSEIAGLVSTPASANLNAANQTQQVPTTTTSSLPQPIPSANSFSLFSTQNVSPCYQFDPLNPTAIPTCDPLLINQAQQQQPSLDQQPQTNLMPVTANSTTNANLLINVPISYNYWPNNGQNLTTLATGINSLATPNIALPTTQQNNILTNPTDLITYKSNEFSYQPPNSKHVDALKRKRNTKKTGSSKVPLSTTRRSKLETETTSTTNYHNLRNSSNSQQPANNKINLRSNSQCDPLMNTNLGTQLITSPYVSMPFFTITPTMNIQTNPPQLISTTANLNLNTTTTVHQSQQMPPSHQLINPVCAKTGKASTTTTTAPSHHQQLVNAVSPVVAKTCKALIGSSNSTTTTTANGNASNLNTPTNNNLARGGRGFKLSSAAAKTSSFFANLHPSRWGKWNNNGQAANNNQSPLLDSSSSSNTRIYHRSSNSSILSNTGICGNSPRNSVTNCNREKIKKWIKEQSRLFVEKYFTETENDTEQEDKDNKKIATNTLKKLKQALEQLDNKDYLKSLNNIKNILVEGDISSFELIHSGLIQKLTTFLTSTETSNKQPDREARICLFLHVFINSPIDSNQLTTNCINEIDSTPFSIIIAKLNACVSHLEQFPVRVHDIMPSSGSGSVRGTSSALKFFHTHQLKCNLQRYKDCKTLKQWKGGAVKIDPLALVSAIERYLVVRGYGRLREVSSDEVNSDDDNSDEDFDDNMAAMMISQGQGRHKLQFLFGDHVLPYNMTVYQAIRQFGSSSSGQSADFLNGIDPEQDNDLMSLWNQTHTIYYRPIPDQQSSQQSSNSALNVASAQTSSSPTNQTNSTTSGNHLSSSNNSNQSNSKKSSSSKSSSKSVNNILNNKHKKDELWLEGKIPKTANSIFECLTSKLPIQDSIQDQSLEVINLLRVLHGLNTYWGYFYNLSTAYNAAIPQSEFVNSKLTAKASRQLMDPLMIMTSNFPLWLGQLAYCCPFLFPFECRHLLFYVTCFDRDRALQRLLDSTQGLNNNDSNERVTPRIEKRKRIITRDDILKQSESLLNDVGNSKSLLEIRYENEVGTGSGPTGI